MTNTAIIFFLVFFSCINLSVLFKNQRSILPDIYDQLTGVRLNLVCVPRVGDDIEISAGIHHRVIAVRIFDDCVRVTHVKWFNGSVNNGGTNGEIITLNANENTQPNRPAVVAKQTLH